ncbi:MAG: class I SAM-dependent methyltransferase [Thermodesulfovibrionales bacterium]
MHKHIEELLSLPSFYDDIPFLISMKNYWPIIYKVYTILSVKSICEIGSFKGDTSKFLIRELEDNIEKFYIVDPKISEDLKLNIANNKKVLIFEEKSVEFLKRGYLIDMYLIDGDHNYTTVKKELELISNSDFKIVCLHDVSWCCADRDFYYDVSDIPKNQKCFTNIYLNIDSNDFSDYGFYFNDMYVSKSYGKGMGVLNAVLDFITDYPDLYDFFSIPSLFGLGFLWNKQILTPEQIDLLESYFESLRVIKPFLAVLEANRLRLIQEISLRDKIIKNMESSIKNMESSISWRITKPLRWLGERIGYKANK